MYIRLSLMPSVLIYRNSVSLRPESCTIFYLIHLAIGEATCLSMKNKML